MSFSAITRSLAASLREVRDEFKNDPDGDLASEDGLDVRLQIQEPGPPVLWCLHYGSSDYDQDHRGYWGSSSLGADTTDEECLAIANELVDQAEESFAESRSGLGAADTDGELALEDE